MRRPTLDLATAKHIAQQAVENQTEPKPAKFSVPLTLLGGERRRADAPMLDPQTCGYICRIEIGAVRVEPPNEQPQPSEDDESINVSTDDEQVQPAGAA